MYNTIHFTNPSLYSIICTIETNKSFEEEKHALASAPILASPYYTKYFIIFSFVSEHIIVVVLMLKKKQCRLHDNKILLFQICPPHNRLLLDHL